jgi:hypothetical protein
LILEIKKSYGSKKLNVLSQLFEKGATENQSENKDYVFSKS